MTTALTPVETTLVTRLREATDPWAPGADEHTVTLPRRDAEQLLQRLRELCAASPDTNHHDCPLCGAPVCTACGLSEPAECPDRHAFEDHCLDCVHACHLCKREVA